MTKSKKIINDETAKKVTLKKNMARVKDGEGYRDIVPLKLSLMWRNYGWSPDVIKALYRLHLLPTVYNYNPETEDMSKAYFDKTDVINTIEKVMSGSLSMIEDYERMHNKLVAAHDTILAFGVAIDEAPEELKIHFDKVLEKINSMTSNIESEK